MSLFGSSPKRSHGAAAVITGAGSGIGKAFARELARRGGRVVCSDLDEASARATADEISINVASAAAFGAAPGMAAHNVGKAGVLSLSETLAAELSGTDVNVTALCPTFVKTNILVSGGKSGAISAQSTQLAEKLMRWTGFSPERVARTCLDTNDRADLYCMPQPDARIGWGIKRFTPTVYTRAVGLTTRATT